MTLFRDTELGKYQTVALLNADSQHMTFGHSTSCFTKVSLRLLLVVFVSLLAVSSFAQTAAPCRASSRYKIIPLPLTPARINDSGVIAGKTEDDQAATWTQSKGARELSIAGDFSNVEPMSLNDAEDIVGQVTVTTTNKVQAFAYIKGKFELLSDVQSKAKAINDAGQIVLEESPGGPILWSAGKSRKLGGCCGGRAFGINNRGEIVGELNDREGHYSAFVWDAERGLQIIAPPGARSSTALAINNSGHMLIQAFSPNRIFLRQMGKLIPVELSTEFASQPLALNDCDVIVGEYGTSSDYYHAFIWDRQHGFRDLNKLVDKAQGWNLESAVDINKRGEIIGTGDHANEGDVGFLLVPDSEPTDTNSTKIRDGKP